MNINLTNLNINNYNNIQPFYPNNFNDILFNPLFNKNNNILPNNNNNLFFQQMFYNQINYPFSQINTNNNNFQFQNQFLFNGLYNNNFYYNNNLNHSINNNNINNKINKNINNNINNNINDNNYNNNSINNKNNLNTKDKKQKKIKRLDPSTYTDIPIEKLSKNFLNLGRDQGGCRYLQKLIEENPTKAIPILYPSLLENLLKLINDPFGNYLLQKIFLYLSQDQIKPLLNILSQNIYDISCNAHGTRTLQTLITKLKSNFLCEIFLNIIKPYVIPLLKDLNGTHVVQKFSSEYPNYSPIINDIIINKCEQLATHRHGCCVIQKYLESNDKIFLNKLLDKLVDNCLILIIDQFGNYVVQSILLVGKNFYGNKIAEKINCNIIYYSKHKYSSNVVEKCFDYCSGKTRENLVKIIMKKENLCDLLFDEHGNYIVQKVLSISEIEIQKQIFKDYC